MERQKAGGSPLHGHLTVLGRTQHPCPPEDRGFNFECLKKRASRSRILVFVFIPRKRGGLGSFPSAVEGGFNDLEAELQTEKLRTSHGLEVSSSPVSSCVQAPFPRPLPPALPRRGWSITPQRNRRIFFLFSH